MRALFYLRSGACPITNTCKVHCIVRVHTCTMVAVMVMSRYCGDGDDGKVAMSLDSVTGALAKPILLCVGAASC
eukprot:4146577-Alexandrium_andersonii.AAC.1